MPEPRPEDCQVGDAALARGAWEDVRGAFDRAIATGESPEALEDLGLAGAGHTTLGVGGFALMPAGLNHFAYTTAAETTMVLYGQGPVEFTYVNAAHDPRHAKSSTR